MKQTLRILASLALATLSAFDLSGCGQGSPIATVAAPAPVSEVDARINEHEKVANEYVRVAKKMKAGDVSLTVRYLDLGRRTREGAAKLQQEPAKMTPEQTQRVAAISAKTAPYLQE